MAGFPIGGDSLSITKGIVSRVTMTRYTHASNKLLGIQIDAAINPGNSGGPSFTDLQHGKVCCVCAPSRPCWPHQDSAKPSAGGWGGFLQALQRRQRG